MQRPLLPRGGRLVARGFLMVHRESSATLSQLPEGLAVALAMSERTAIPLRKMMNTQARDSTHPCQLQRHPNADPLIPDHTQRDTKGHAISPNLARTRSRTCHRATINETGQI
jgi:hypothetical protein